VTVVDERLMPDTFPPPVAARAWNTYWLVSIAAVQICHGPDLVQAAMTCQCQPQLLRHAQCFVFALTLPRRELADDQRFSFKLQDKS